MEFEGSAGTNASDLAALSQSDDARFDGQDVFLRLGSGESITLNSISLENNARLYFELERSAELPSTEDASVTVLTLLDQSTVSRGSIFYFGGEASASTNSENSVQLLLGAPLTVHGIFALGDASSVSASESGTGKVVVVGDSGYAYDGWLLGDITLNAELEISRGATLYWATQGFNSETVSVSGTGLISNYGDFQLNIGTGSLGVDVVNTGSMTFFFSNINITNFKSISIWMFFCFYNFCYFK